MRHGPGAVIEVSEVRHVGRGDGLKGHLDLPTTGVVEEDHLSVVGWVVGTDAVAAEGIEVTSKGGRIGRVALSEARADVQRAFPGGTTALVTGFRMTVPIIGTSPLELGVDAVLVDGRRLPLARIHARRRYGEQSHTGTAALVSVVLTQSDPEVRTEPAVESVLAQTYPNFELVVVDAGGGGTSSAAPQLPNAKVIRSRAGAAAARNAGLRASAGSVVLFLDATERLLPNALEVGLRELATQPASAFVSGKCVVTREYHDQPEYPQQPLITADNYAVLLGQNYVLTPAAAMFRRAALEAVGGFDESLEAFDDYDMYLRLARDFEVGCHEAAVVESPADDPLRVVPEVGRAALDRVLDAQVSRVAGDSHLEAALQLGRRAWAWRSGTADDAPVPRELDFGHLRRLAPISTNFGFDRGRPVDRYYIESFLAEHADDVRGRVLEVQENDYTLRFGGDRVETSEVVSLLPDNPKATIVGDLATGETIPDGAFDCAIVTQVLHLIHDPRDAVRTLCRILKPGGVALVTVPGISQVEWSESWHWSFTLLSARQMFSDVFGPANVRARSYGNVLAATSFLWGIAVEELEEEELDFLDPNYPVTIVVRAVKPDTG
jgi:SAM-dependent methyltransferase